ncbi:MAG TPA: hypothetical protein VFA12_16100 [Stellaceae bacterium]|nr:hypothetical protein [Stellaceae bacterium]
MWRAAEEDFWRRVADAVRKIFNQDPQKVELFRAGMASAAPLEKSLILHDDPLYVAADIAGVEVEEDDLRRYEAEYGSP